MNPASGPWDDLAPEAAPMSRLRDWLDRIGYDQFQQMARQDYFTSPFPDRETFTRRLAAAPAHLDVAMRLLLLADPLPGEEIVRGIGLETAEAMIETGLISEERTGGAFSTGGRSLVSWLGTLLLVSANPRYPAYRPDAGEVYMGPDSLALAAELARSAAEIPPGDGLDLCAGSGVAGLSMLARGRAGDWTGIDQSAQAVHAARFNAALNGAAQRYTPLQGDLYDPVRGRRFGVVACNPPFIPVPGGHDFPLYGAGGEDGATVLRPVIAGLPCHLAPGGMAVIYAEGTGDQRGPFILADLAGEAGRLGLDFSLRIISSVPAATALYTLGQMLAGYTPSRLPELEAWTALFERTGAKRYIKYLLKARHGPGRLEVTSLAI